MEKSSLFFNESTFTVNNHACDKYVRRPEKKQRTYFISPTIKHPYANGVGRLEVVFGGMNGKKYVLERKMFSSAHSLFSDCTCFFL